MAIRKREPLRIPQSWKDQARAFVIQLERILDDIYKRFFGTEIPLSDKDSETVSEAIAKINDQIVSVPIAKDSIDLNDYTDIGGYSLHSTNSTYLHAPFTGTNCQLYVLDTRMSWRIQVLYYNNIWFYRVKATPNSSWLDWQQIARFEEQVFPAGNGTLVNSACNFNDLLDIGIYTFGSSATVASSTNRPCDYAGKLLVYNSNGSTGGMTQPWNYRVQLYYDVSGGIHTRQISTNASSQIGYSPWQHIATTAIHGLSESKTTAATDLDNCYYAGTYLYNPNTLHIPYAGYGLCFVVATDDPSSTGVGWVNQIAITTKSDPDVWVRKRINNGSWTTWQCISTTASAAAMGGRTSLSVSLYRCTGTTTNSLYYHSAGNTIIIEGRLTITDYVRTGSNPGFTITIPNSKKLKQGTKVNCGLTWSSNSTEGTRANEMLELNAVPDATTATVQTTETYTNMSSATRVTFTIFPVAFEIY